jgi:hypothetical protein
MFFCIKNEMVFSNVLPLSHVCPLSKTTKNLIYLSKEKYNCKRDKLAFKTKGMRYPPTSKANKNNN